MTYVVIKSVFSSIPGVAVGWNKLKRVGCVRHSYEHNEASKESRLSALFLFIERVKLIFFTVNTFKK